MLDFPDYKTSAPSPLPTSTPSLLQWLYQVINVPKLRLQVRSRGNNLYILCEGNRCPEAATIVANLVRGLMQRDLQSLLPTDQAVIYQVVLYGREKGRQRPDWAEVLQLDQLEQHLEGMEVPRPAGSAALVVSNFSLAKQGQPDAIARYLSEELSSLGIAVQANARSVVLETEATLPQTANLASVFSTQGLTAQGLLSRLWILCESPYSPDATMMSDLIARKLRGLELTGFRDAIVYGQVQGEAEPDWTLRVDLTPPSEMLKEWARWGDQNALTLLLNRVLAAQQVQVSANLLEMTLHLSYQSQPAPGRQRVLAATVPLIETIAPQGIHSIACYGVEQQSDQISDQIPETPAWIEWLTLPAAEHPALSDSTQTLAEQGDLSAIAFLLTRQLNPDLESHLKTGGIRIQLRQKEDLLHVMADAPVCPPQSHVSATVTKFIKALSLPDVKGVRIYGRRAGQTRPLWTQGADFASRHRFVPAAVPEFAASDAYVGDLISTQAGALVPRSEAEEAKLSNRIVEVIQRWMVRSHLFTLSQPASLSESAKPATRQEKALALVWGLAGLMMMIQSDWGLGQLIKQKPAAPVAAATATPQPSEKLELPTLSLQKTRGFGEFQAGSRFTQDGQTLLSSPSQPSTGDEPGKTLVSSPLRPKAAIDSARSPYPTLNAKQLDEKLVLYREYVNQHGAPDVLIVGSSRALRGVDPVALQQTLATQGYTNLKVFNFGINGATVQVIDLLVRRMLSTGKMPKLILWADGSRAFNSGRVDVTYNAIAASPGFKKLPDAPSGGPSAAFTEPLEKIAETNSTVVNGYQAANAQLNQFLGRLSTVYGQRDKLSGLLREAIAAHLGSPTADDAIALEGTGLIDVNGFLPIANRFNPATYYQKYSKVPGNVDGDYANFLLSGRQHEALKNLTQFTKSQNIPLVFVNLPLTQEYLDSDRRAREQEFQQYLTQSAAELGFTYRDLMENWKDTHDFFSDPSHINRYGAYAVAQHLAKDPLIPWVKR
jgi:hypothetical protein